MLRLDITKDDLVSAIRGMDLKEFPTSELDFLISLLKLKTLQAEAEYRKRRANGE